MTGVPIINYHFFSNETSSGFYCSKKDLISHVAYLKKNYTLLPLTKALEILEYGRTTDKCVCITIDDGEESLFKIAWPVFKDFDVPVQVNLITGGLGKTINSYDIPSRIMNLQEINQLCNSGLVTFASHSMNHRKMSELSRKEIEYELAESKKVIEDIADECRMFCYPYGGVKVITSETETILYEQHYTYALTTAGGQLKHGTDRFRISRINIEDHVSLNKLRFYCSDYYYIIRFMKDLVSGNRFHNAASIGGRIGIK
jgi:peptidoglycan/xylan/chitin deacetylase (PgdA/CDA1 family)